VRLLPATNPEKTNGVKRLMDLIATQLQESSAGSRFGKTNLADFLTTLHRAKVEPDKRALNGSSTQTLLEQAP
jgi:hypothetical protein